MDQPIYQTQIGTRAHLLKRVGGARLSWSLIPYPETRGIKRFLSRHPGLERFLFGSSKHQNRQSHRDARNLDRHPLI